MSNLKFKESKIFSLKDFLNEFSMINNNNNNLNYFNNENK